jgi:4'-phosphopantetheinyl transferase
MRLLLYTVEYCTEFSPADIQIFMSKLPPFLQQKALRFRRWQDAYGCIFGSLLLMLGSHKLGFPCDLEKLEYSPGRKPFLRGGPHFNISHSANRVVCLFATDRRVGVDIEYFSHDISLEHFTSQFTPAEWDMIHSANSPKEQFYQVWTAKESLIKADGRGLGIPLNEIDVSRADTIALAGITWKLAQVSAFDGYACHLCVEDVRLSGSAKDGDAYQSFSVTEPEIFEVRASDLL